MRRLLFLLAAILPCQTAAAQFNPNAKIGSNDPHLNDGMVFSLPTGENTLYLTIVTHDVVEPNTRDAQVLAWFDQDPRLNKLKKQCNFNHYWHSNGHYAVAQGKGGMGRCYGIGYPCVAITKANGEIIANAYYLNKDGKRGYLPDTSGALADYLWQKLDAQLKAPDFKSYSSSPGNMVGAVAPASDCRPDDPDCNPNQVPGPNTPALPETPPNDSFMPYVKEYAPAGIVMAIMAAVLLFLKNRQAVAPVVAVAPAAPKQSNSFFS